MRGAGRGGGRRPGRGPAATGVTDERENPYVRGAAGSRPAHISLLYTLVGKVPSV
jgi:hypothetical protein